MQKTSKPFLTKQKSKKKVTKCRYAKRKAVNRKRKILMREKERASERKKNGRREKSSPYFD